MKRNYLITILLCSILSLQSCKGSPEINVINKSKKIGFINLIRDRFDGIYIGTIAFKNRHFSVSQTGWNLTRVSNEYILRTLKKNTNFSIRQAHYNKAKLQKLQLNSSKVFSGNQYFKELNRIAKQQGFDTLLVLEQGFMNIKGVRSSKIGEYGLYHAYQILPGHRICVFIKYGMRLYSAQSGKTIGMRRTSNLDPYHGYLECPGNTSKNGDARLTTQYKHREQFELYSKSEKAVMQNKIKKQFSKSIKKDLQCLKLTRKKRGRNAYEDC